MCVFICYITAGVASYFVNKLGEILSGLSFIFMTFQFLDQFLRVSVHVSMGAHLQDSTYCNPSFQS